MNPKKFIVWIAIVTTFILGGGAWVASKAGKASVQANPEVEVQITESAFDWGEIGLEDGNVEKIFEIRNKGSQNLELSSVSTSCTCTTAQLILDNELSPLFGMHSKSDYVLEVPPGETALLKVIFDPAFHGPSGVGPVTRQVTVTTNDPDKPILNFMLTAVVRGE